MVLGMPRDRFPNDLHQRTIALRLVWNVPNRRCARTRRPSKLPPDPGQLHWLAVLVQVRTQCTNERGFTSEERDHLRSIVRQQAQLRMRIEPA